MASSAVQLLTYHVWSGDGLNSYAEPHPTPPLLGGLDDLSTVPELAAALKIGRNTAYELIRAGIVPSIRIGRQIRISKQAIIDYIARSERETAC